MRCWVGWRTLWGCVSTDPAPKMFLLGKLCSQLCSTLSAVQFRAQHVILQTAITWIFCGGRSMMSWREVTFRLCRCLFQFSYYRSCQLCHRTDNLYTWHPFGHALTSNTPLLLSTVVSIGLFITPFVTPSVTLSVRLPSHFFSWHLLSFVSVFVTFSVLQLSQTLSHFLWAC